MVFCVSLFFSVQSFAVEKINIDAQQMQKEALALYEDEIKSIKKEVMEKQATFLQSGAYQEMREDAHQTIQNLKQSIKGQKNVAGEVLVFVSWSMPEVAIKQWMSEAENFDASINVQGLIAENFPKSIAKMQKFVEENNSEGGINIDPELFERYGVKKVPAVVVRQYDNPDSPFDMVYGTSTIKEALKIISEEGIEAKEQAGKRCAT